MHRYRSILINNPVINLLLFKVMEGQPTVEEQQVTKVAFLYGLSLGQFQQSIRHNFQLVQQLLESHSKAINGLKLQLNNSPKEKQLATPSRGKERTINPEGDRNEAERKEDIPVQMHLNGENSKINQLPAPTNAIIVALQEQKVHIQAEQNIDGPVVVHQQADLKRLAVIQQQAKVEESMLVERKIEAEGPAFIQSQHEVHASKIILQQSSNLLPFEQTEYKLPQNFSDAQKKAIQTKIFELFERVRQLQEKGIFESRQYSKSLKELQFQIQANVKSIEKNAKQNQGYTDEVQKLRNQLSEYKLKKEAKLSKLVHLGSMTQSQTGGVSSDDYDYIAEKLQFLLKNVKSLLSKESFEEERELLQENIDFMRKKMGGLVNEQYLTQTIKNVEIKIYNSVSKYIKAKSMQGKRDGGNQTQESEEQVLNAIIEEGNNEFLQKVSLHEQRFTDLTVQIQRLRSQFDMGRRDKLKYEVGVAEEFKDVQQRAKQLRQITSQNERNHQEFKQKMTQNHLDSQNQIIDLQDQVEKINSHIKTYSYSVPEAKQTVNSKYKQGPTGEHLVLSSHELPGQSQSSVTLENEVSVLRKKLGKLTMKVQGVKEDFLTLRQEQTRELDGLKMGIEKKADWDSLKKGLSYFEDRLKETKMVVQHLYAAGSGQKGQGDDSLAVKKGWTCLMCDRDIKNYEGKLSEMKFTSMFPVRESPRIGGYYKQQQMSQEYKQVFMNPRGKRVASLKSNQTNNSREDLNN